MVGNETTGRGKQFPWDCLEQAAQRGCGCPSLEVFKAHQDTALCNVLKGPCLSWEVGRDDTQWSLPTQTTLGLDSVSWSCSPQLLDAAVLSSSSWSARQEHSPVRGSND